MNSLPDAGAHPGNIDVGVIKVRTANRTMDVISPLAVKKEKTS
jgi:hypothetical protein